MLYGVDNSLDRPAGTQWQPRRHILHHPRAHAQPARAHAAEHPTLTIRVSPPSASHMMRRPSLASLFAAGQAYGVAATERLTALHLCWPR